MKSEHVTRSVFALFVVIGAVGCAPEEPPADPPPRPVIAWEVSEPRSTVIRSFTGATEAADSAQISFEISGRITTVHAVRGRRYEAGTVLAELDVTTYRSELARAEAEANRAAQELRRVQQLFESDNASRAQFDSAVAAQKSAMATLATARKRVDDGTLRMPYDGVVGEVLAEEQEVVSPGVGVFRLQGAGAMEFEVGVPADVIASIDIGTVSSVRLGSLPGRRFPATVIKVSREISENTTYPVTLELSGSPVDVREGLDGEAEFELPNPRGPTITVPIESIVGAPDATRFVWVVTGGAGAISDLRRQLVETGQLRSGGTIEVLTGLRAGQKIVIRGVHQLVEGTEVRIELRSGNS